jgi:putative Mn2+ efflux pump MntP
MNDLISSISISFGIYVSVVQFVLSICLELSWIDILHTHTYIFTFSYIASLISCYISSCTPIQGSLW